jgi:SAM-dependent methyltransferase
MTRPAWAPEEIDTEQPNIARVYDWLLGGSHNFPADRMAGQLTSLAMPALPYVMRTNRAFLGRAVRHLAAAGIRQFLDLGSGIPTADNVHDVAQRMNPECRVVYVDVDPVAVAQSRVMLAGNDRAAIVQADLRQPVDVLTAPQTRALFDLDKPVAVLMVAVLHFLSDAEQPQRLVRSYRDALSPGSHVVISHASLEREPPAGLDAAHRLYESAVAPITFRTSKQVTELVAGFELLQPGVVTIPLWRPDSEEDTGQHPEYIPALAVVGRKPRW